MIGARINDGSLSTSDYVYLKVFLNMLLAVGKPLHHDFKISVMDYSETREDFLVEAQKNAPAAMTDFALITCIPNSRPSSNEEFTQQVRAARLIEGENSFILWQSPLTRNLTAWNDACIQSTAKMIGTVALPNNFEVNPQDFSEDHFSLLSQKTNQTSEKETFALLQRTL